VGESHCPTYGYQSVGHVTVTSLSVLIVGVLLLV